MAMRRVETTVERPDQGQGLAALAAILTAATIIAGLYLARDVLIPLALAILISFVLAPLAHALRRFGIPRVPAVIAVVVLSFGAILGVGALGTAQISSLAQDLPQYQSHIRDKIRDLRGSATNSGPVSRATSVIQDIGQELSGSGPAAAGLSPQSAGTRAGAPLPVEIQLPGANPFKVASDVLMAIFSPVASTFLIVLFVIFFLLQQEDLRDRIIKLLGARELHRTTEAMQDAASGLSRYFLLQTVMNALSGLLIGLGLWVIGVPSPVLWGIFTMLMRFVPYIGSIIAGVVPVALAAAVDPGWTMAVWTAMLYITAEGVMGQIVEPLVYGRQTGLSPLAIMVAATFWTWLWGPIGLILATPLTMCLVILGQYTKRLEFLRVLLGDQPALTPPESFYQRLIAGDPAEIIDQADRHLKTVTLADYYDTIAMPGLVLAQRDASTGELSVERQALLATGIAELIDGLTDHVDSASHPDPAGPKVALSLHQADLPGAVVCIGGRGAVDQAAGALLCQLIERSGIGARMSSDPGVAGLVALEAEKLPASLVCLSLVGTARSTHVRFLVRRIHRLFPAADVLVGLWEMPPADAEWAVIKEALVGETVVVSLNEAVASISANIARADNGDQQHSDIVAVVQKSPISSPIPIVRQPALVPLGT